MTAKTFAAVRADLELASNCQTAAAKATLDFQAACNIGDWHKAEEARGQVIGSMEAFLDNYAAAFKVMRDV